MLNIYGENNGMRKMILAFLVILCLTGCVERVITQEEKQKRERWQKEHALRHNKAYQNRYIIYQLEEINKKLDKLIEK